MTYMHRRNQGEQLLKLLARADHDGLNLREAEIEPLQRELGYRGWRRVHCASTMIAWVNTDAIYCHLLRRDDGLWNTWLSH